MDIKPVAHENYWGLNIEAVGQRYPTAKFIADTQIPVTVDGVETFTNVPMSIFSQEPEHVPANGSTLFGIWFRHRDAHISDAKRFLEVNPVNAVLNTKTGDLLWSRFRHDFVTKTVDGEQAFIDGGREYCRFGYEPGTSWTNVKYDLITNEVIGYVDDASE